VGVAVQALLENIVYGLEKKHLLHHILLVVEEEEGQDFHLVPVDHL
jgi:hypothetical protein